MALIFKVGFPTFNTLFFLSYILSWTHTQLKSRPLSESNETVTCKVKFSGSNVFEGIKESVAYGCVALPVPTVLTSLPQCSTNRVTVEIEKQPLLLGNGIRNADSDNNENS